MSASRRCWPSACRAQGLPWWGAVVAVVLMGALVGLINGMLVTRVKIDSFIATLGTGTVLYGLNAWYTGGQQVLASLPPEFLALSGNIGDRSRAGDLCADRQPRALGRVRISAARPLPLRAWREPARGGAERHLGQALRHPRLRRRRHRSPPSPASCCNRSCRSGRARSARNICCRHSPRRCSARRRSGRDASMSGDGAGGRGARRHRRRAEPARRAVLRRAAVQRLDADPGRRSWRCRRRSGANAAAPRRTRRRQPAKRRARRRLGRSQATWTQDGDEEMPDDAGISPVLRPRMVQVALGAGRPDAATAI